MTRLYLLDLDRTSFNTQRFVQNLTRFMEQIFQLDPTTFEAQIKQHTLPNELGYDFYAHATAATGQSQPHIHRRVREHFHDADYTYPDVKPWIATRQAAGDQVLVVTVGERQYQTLKLELAPPLCDLPHAIVAQNKGVLLRAYLDRAAAGEGPQSNDPLAQSLAGLAPHASITLIDDNPRTFSELGPHSAVRQIHLARPDEKFSAEPAPDHATTITSLKEFS